MKTKLKIAVASSELLKTPPQGWGGMERSAYSIARHASELGHDVQLFTRRFRRGETALYNGIKVVSASFPELSSEKYDVVWVFNCRLVSWINKMANEYPNIIFVFEHNFPFIPKIEYAENILHFAMCPSIFYELSWHGKKAKLVEPLLIKEELDFVETPKDYILWLGRIHPEKNPKGISEFANKVTMPVFVAGPLNGRNTLQESANMQICGSIDGAAKRKLLSEAKALLYTVDPYWCEAGGMAIAEALACGVPVLGQKGLWGSPLEYRVQHGLHGFIESSPKDLARHLCHCNCEMRKAIRKEWWPRLDPHLVVQRRVEAIISFM